MIPLAILEVIKQFWNTTKSGVYFKVLKTGSVEKDAAFLLVEHAKNTASVAEIYNTKKKYSLFFCQ
jgi:MOSC domain-containing protein YiiM